MSLLYQSALVQNLVNKLELYPELRELIYQKSQSLTCALERHHQLALNQEILLPKAALLSVVEETILQKVSILSQGLPGRKISLNPSTKEEESLSACPSLLWLPGSQNC